VLLDCFAKGVPRDLFAYGLADWEQKTFDTICFNDKAIIAADCEIIETVWLIRPALAKTLIPEPGVGGGAGTGGHEPEPGGTGPALSGSPDTGKKGGGGGDGLGVVAKDEGTRSDSRSEDYLSADAYVS
jgi:hypothetical protein